MRRWSALGFAVLTLASCKNNAGNNDVNEVPSANGSLVSQSEPFPENKCDAGGIQGAPTEGQGWTFDPRMGCYLKCASEDALKSDFLAQILNHRLYGKIEDLAAKDPEGARIARFYRDRQQKLGLTAGPFAELTKDQLFDGDKWTTMKEGIKPGDILLNMAFGTPNRAGAFYSKRGMAHAELVVKVEGDRYQSLDGGWGAKATWKTIASQTVWLRPRAEYFTADDLKNLLQWAENLMPMSYDNTLTDDWKEFRAVLNAELDSGKQRSIAQKVAFDLSEAKNFPPKGFAASFKYQPPSGLYCSEGISAIFAYLGYRLIGDRPLELITAFSDSGKLPPWEIYLDALEGFDANTGGPMLMHKAFWNFFIVFDQARQKDLIQIPGYPKASAGTFSEAITANLKAIEADGGLSDHLHKQLDDVIDSLQKTKTQPELLSLAIATKEGLERIAQGLSLKQKRTINITQAAYSIYLGNTAFGPHTFLENSKYFELKGIFYNSNVAPEAYGQARWVASIDRLKPGTDTREFFNISTTLYSVVNDASLPTDRCVVANKAPPLEWMPSNALSYP